MFPSPRTPTQAKLLRLYGAVVALEGSKTAHKEDVRLVSDVESALKRIAHAMGGGAAESRTSEAGVSKTRLPFGANKRVNVTPGSLVGNLSSRLAGMGTGRNSKRERKSKAAPADEVVHEEAAPSEAAAADELEMV